MLVCVVNALYHICDVDGSIELFKYFYAQRKAGGLIANDNDPVTMIGSVIRVTIMQQKSQFSNEMKQRNVTGTRMYQDSNHVLAYSHVLPSERTETRLSGERNTKAKSHLSLSLSLSLSPFLSLFLYHSQIILAREGASLEGIKNRDGIASVVRGDP